MAPRARRPHDFTTSFLDLCCCALGGLILLMVLLVPTPKQGATQDGAPLERPIVLELRLPTDWMDPALGPRPDGGDLAPLLVAGEVDLGVAVGGGGTFQVPAVHVDGFHWEQQTEVGRLTVDCTHEAPPSPPLLTGTEYALWMLNAPVAPNLVVRVTWILPADAVSDERYDLRVDARVTGPEAEISKHLLPLWTALPGSLRDTRVAATPSNGAGPGGTAAAAGSAVPDPTFPVARLSVMPEATSSVVWPRVVPLQALDVKASSSDQPPFGLGLLTTEPADGSKVEDVLAAHIATLLPGGSYSVWGNPTIAWSFLKGDASSPIPARTGRLRFTLTHEATVLLPSDPDDETRRKPQARLEQSLTLDFVGS